MVEGAVPCDAGHLKPVSGDGPSTGPQFLAHAASSARGINVPGHPAPQAREGSGFHGGCQKHGGTTVRDTRACDAVR